MDKIRNVRSTKYNVQREQPDDLLRKPILKLKSFNFSIRKGGQVLTFKILYKVLCTKKAT